MPEVVILILQWGAAAFAVRLLLLLQFKGRAEGTCMDCRVTGVEGEEWRVVLYRYCIRKG